MERFSPHAPHSSLLANTGERSGSATALASPCLLQIPFIVLRQ